MKKIKPIIFYWILLAIGFSCGEKTSSFLTTPLKEGEMLIGNFQASGVHTVTLDKASIMSMFGGRFYLSKIDYVKSYTNKNNIVVLEFAGPHKDGVSYVTVGKVL